MKEENNKIEEKKVKEIERQTGEREEVVVRKENIEKVKVLGKKEKRRKIIIQGNILWKKVRRLMMKCGGVSKITKKLESSWGEVYVKRERRRGEEMEIYKGIRRKKGQEWVLNKKSVLIWVKREMEERRSYGNKRKGGVNRRKKRG